MKSFGSSRARLLAGSMVLVFASPAFAQQEGATAPVAASVATAEGASVGGLDDIIVTARRRAESVQDIPVAIQAMSAEMIERRDLTSLEKIAASTPQFTVARASNGAGAQLTMRGIGSSATSIGIEQSVAIVVDGVYYGQGRIINEGFFDLARVEVLKGPQALFFGKNATAGVISLTTADPGDELEIIGRVGYEFHAEQLQGEVIVSTPITDTLGVRVAVRGSKMWGGFYENRSNDDPYVTMDAGNALARTTHIAPAAATDQPQERELIGRVTVKWDPTDDLTVNLKGSGTSNETVGNGWNYTPVNCTNNVTTANPAYVCKRDFILYQNDLPPALAASLPYARDDGELYNKYRSWQVTGTVNYSADFATFTSITNYNWNNNRFTCDCDFLGGDTWATENASFNSFSQELRALTSFEGPINFMVGGLFQSTERKFYQAVVFAGSEDSRADPQNRFISYAKDSSTKGKTWSGYGQVMWEIVPSLEATGGVRYIHETKNSVFTQPYVNALLTGLFRPESAPVNGTLYGDQTFNDWSPEFTLSWKPVEDVLVYGAYRSAYKSGGFSNSAINSALVSDPVGDLMFAPEKGKGFEIGLKSTLFERQLRFNLNAYDFKYTDLQIDYFNSQVFAYVTYNAGEARSRGIEAEVEFAPNSAPGLSMRGSLNYNKSNYENFDAPCYAGQRPDQGCTMMINGVPYQDLSGVPTSMAPKWTATIGASYDTDISDTLRIGGNFDGRYSDSYIGSGFGDPRTHQPAYMVMDAGVKVGATNDRWQVALIGKNLTNQYYFLGGGTAPLTGSGTGTPSAVPGDILGYGSAPRTIQMQLTVRY